MALTDAIFPLFPNFATPDLGCLVRRKHELEVEPGSANIHVEFMPSIELQPRLHQTYFRVKCGSAAFFQRCLIFKTRDLNIPGPILQNFPPDFVLGGDRTPVLLTGSVTLSHRAQPSTGSSVSTATLRSPNGGPMPLPGMHLTSMTTARSARFTITTPAATAT